MKDQERLQLLETQVSVLVNSQKEFTSKALQLLALSAKTIYSKDEAALFLNLDPNYLYQLKFHGKLKAYKKKGQKSKNAFQPTKTEILSYIKLEYPQLNSEDLSDIFGKNDR